jgi:hypothetical protein
MLCNVIKGQEWKTTNSPLRIAEGVEKGEKYLFCKKSFNTCFLMFHKDKISEGGEQWMKN